MHMEASLPKNAAYIYIYTHTYVRVIIMIISITIIIIIIIIQLYIYMYISLPKSIGTYWHSIKKHWSPYLISYRCRGSEVLATGSHPLHWRGTLGQTEPIWCWSTQQIHQETHIFKGLWSMALRPPTRPRGILKRDRLDGALTGMVWFQIDDWGHLQP